MNQKERLYLRQPEWKCWLRLPETFLFLTFLAALFDINRSHCHTESADYALANVLHQVDNTCSGIWKDFVFVFVGYDNWSFTRLP